MRTALICAICFFCGAALLAPPAQLFKISPLRSGPYALRGSQMWSVGPLQFQEPFVIPENPPGSPVIIFTGASANTVIEKLLGDGSWETVFANRPPRPGLRMSPGTYRTGGSPAYLFGYYAPVSSFYPGCDSFPDQNHLWQCQPVMDGSYEFTVPADKTYVMSYAEEGVEKWDNGGWVEMLGTLEEGSPGIKLAPGLYRVGAGIRSNACALGYITTEN